MSLSLGRTRFPAPGLLLTAVVVAALAACSGSTSTPSPAAATSAASAAPSPSPEAATPSPAATAAAASAAATGVPVAVDPCQVVTQSEASALAGTTFGAGKSETLSGGGKMCTYGGQTTNVFEVVVVQAPDAATAQADWAQEQTKAQDSLKQGVPAGVSLDFKVDDVTNISGADKAAIATMNASISGVSLAVAGVYLLKGAYFLSFSDLTVGHAAPSQSAMEAQAATSLGRLP